MKLLITRPEETADRLADKLTHAGHEVIISPLIHIEFRETYSLSNPISLDGVQAFVVTSANGVRGLERVTTNRTLPLFAVGDKSATIAKQAGFQTVHSADGNVDALGALILKTGQQTDGIFLHAGGARLAGDLKDLLTNVGFKYHREILYDAVDATVLDKDAKSALEDGSLDGILLFSPHTATVFKSIVEQQGLLAHLKGVTAWCLSNNTAKVIIQLPFGKRFVAVKPTETSLLEEIAMSAVETTDKGEIISGKAREQIVSETPKNENAGQSDKNKSEASRDSLKGSINKPLPNSLTGNGHIAAERSANPKKSNIGKISLALFVMFCLGLAAWPIIYPKVSPYLPQETREIVQGYLGNPVVDNALEGRLSALEKKAPVDLGTVEADLQKSQADMAALQENVSTFMDQSTESVKGLEAQLHEQVAENQALKSSIQALKEIAIKGPTARAVVSSDMETAPEVLSSINLLSDAVEDLRKELENAQQDLRASQTEASVAKDQIAALSKALQSQVDMSANIGSNEEEALTLLALGQLQRESRNDQPFEGALQQAIATAPVSMQADLSNLVNAAKLGAPLSRDLSLEFGAIATDITQASRLPSSQTWYGKTLHNIASMVKFRRTDAVEGNSTDAIVSRAEKKLNANDLAGATAELKGLEEAPQAVAAAWIQKASRRVLVDRALHQLLKTATTTAVNQSKTAK